MRVTNLTINVVTVDNFTIQGFQTVDIPDDRYLTLQVEFSALIAAGIISLPLKQELSSLQWIDREWVTPGYDFTSFTFDSQVHSLDFSSIIPDNAKLVKMFAMGGDTETGEYLYVNFNYHGSVFPSLGFIQSIGVENLLCPITIWFSTKYGKILDYSGRVSGEVGTPYAFIVAVGWFV